MTQTLHNSMKLANPTRLPSVPGDFEDGLAIHPRLRVDLQRRQESRRGHRGYPPSLFLYAERFSHDMYQFVEGSASEYSIAPAQ